jgi:hypothetical protein
MAERLDDVVTNQAALTHALAHTSLVDFDSLCADDPLSSRSCRQADCGREYAEWLGVLGEPLMVARKEWEHAAICRALDAAGVLRPGARGLGFGVGREPLVAAFAARGVAVVATDLAADDARAAGWSATNQHALTLDGLLHPSVCSAEVLRAQVEVRAVDMNAIPDDLVGSHFDFVWSACAFEHLGSLEAGLEFVARSAACLRPGGIAVHTTEFNVESDDRTLTSGPTVAYRRQDFAALERRLAAAGHTMAPFVAGERTGVFDYLIDVPPHHFGALLVRVDSHLLTSAVIVVRAGT